jgi:hypothetical protein
MYLFYKEPDKNKQTIGKFCMGVGIIALLISGASHDLLLSGAGMFFMGMFIYGWA